MKTALQLTTLAFLVNAAFADQVTMKNGDRLSGGIVKYDGKNLVFRSELAGPVTIPWDAVTAIDSSAPLNVGLKDGQVIVGAVSTKDGKLEVTTKETGAVTASRKSIQYIRSKDEQAAYETETGRVLKSTLMDLWAAFLDLT